MQIPYPANYDAKTEEKSMSQVTTAYQYQSLPPAFKAAFPQKVYGDESMPEVAKYIECILGPDAEGELHEKAQRILELTGWADVCETRRRRSGICITPKEDGRADNAPVSKLPFNVWDLAQVYKNAMGSITIEGFSGIQTVPFTLGTVPFALGNDLQTLKLVNLYSLSYLPRFPSLRELTIQCDCGNASLPEGMDKLPALETVELIGQGFKKLPEVLQRIENLRNIKLLNTQISDLPDWALHMLKDVNITNVHKTEAPPLTPIPTRGRSTEAIDALFSARRGSSWLYSIVLIIVGLACAYFHFSRTQTPAAPQLD